MAGKKIPSLGNQIPDTKPDQERYLPIANVSRIMKKSLPTNAKISKDAKETVQECVSEFINFITGEASDKCQREKRKTINGDDILWAMTTLGFENYVRPLNVYLNMHRDNTEGDKITMASSSPMDDAGENVEIFTGSDYHQSQNFNSGNNYFLSLGSQFDPKIGYSENFEIDNDGFDETAKRAMATELQHGMN